jgi:hypothetical protein
VRITLDEVLDRIRSVISNHLLSVQNSKFKIQKSKPPVLLIEGAGGLLAPLGEGFDLLDIIAATARLPSDWFAQSRSPGQSAATAGIRNPTSRIEQLASGTQTVIVARNQLGTINHTLLTVAALRHRFEPLTQSEHGPRFTFETVLMDPQRHDASASSNAKILAEMLSPRPVHTISFLGKKPLDRVLFQWNLKRLKRTLSRILQ